MKRLFKETDRFRRRAGEVGLDDEMLMSAQQDILNGLGDVIAGTAGLKKIRCSAQGRGKRGGMRIIFADYPSAGVTYLLWVWPKNQAGNLTSDKKELLRKLKLMINKEVQQ